MNNTFPQVIRTLHTFLLSITVLSFCSCAPSAEERDQGVVTSAEEDVSGTSFGDLEKLLESRLSTFGKKHADEFNVAIAALTKKGKSYKELEEPGGGGPYNQALALTYYDRAHAFYEIATILKDEKWLSEGDKAALFFRDKYVINAAAPEEQHGVVPGYWDFSDGLVKHFQRTQEAKSRDAVFLLAERARYASSVPSAHERAESAERSREVAYGIIAHLNAESLGRPAEPWRDELIQFAIGHTSQWLGKTPWNGIVTKRPYVQPFMVGLTSRALVMASERVGRNDVQAPLEALANFMWQEMWVPGSRAFRYTNRFSEKGEVIPDGAFVIDPAPDLNLIVFPLYAWLAQRTGNPMYRDQALEILRGGIANAFWTGGKQFNQQLFWVGAGLEYLKKAEAQRAVVKKGKKK